MGRVELFSNRRIPSQMEAIPNMASSEYMRASWACQIRKGLKATKALPSRPVLGPCQRFPIA